MGSRAAAAELEVVVDDRRVRVPAGPTVAATLLNLGIWSFRRSVSGEARGPVCGMGVCAECRVTIDGAPHQRSCLIAIADGMRIRTPSER